MRAAAVRPLPRSTWRCTAGLSRTCGGWLLAALLVCAGAVTACTPAPTRVLMFGDSITMESQHQLSAHGIEVHAFGGTAICDWLAAMRTQAATGSVRKVYLEFVGNRFTACITSRPELAAYASDAVTAVAIWRAHHVRVVWVRPPEPRPVAAASLARRQLVAANAELLATPSFDEVQTAEQQAGADAYVDTDPLIAPGRVFTPTVPCRGSEPCAVLAPAGFDAARSSDGVHLCPTTSGIINGVVTGVCTVYATSEQRFADQVTNG